MTNLTGILPEYTWADTGWMTAERLLEVAEEWDVPDAGSMTKAELRRAVFRSPANVQL